MATDKQIAERLNEWVGCNHMAFTENEIKDLVWALAMDPDLKDDFTTKITQARAELLEERRAEDDTVVEHKNTDDQTMGYAGVIRRQGEQLRS